MREFDLAVIGGGPGGYTAAIRAAQLGFSVALIEAEHLGGVCLNWGCIPTKSLLHSADLLREVRHAADWGVKVGAPEVDLKAMVQQSRNAAQQLNRGVTGLMKKNRIEVIDGFAQLSGPNTIEVGDASIHAEFIILATGARARNLPHIAIDGNRIWGPREAMTPSFQPKRLLIIGAGAIGAEFASFYNTIGTEVTLVEALDQILPVEDTEIAEGLQQSFANAGIEVRTGTTVDGLTYAGDSLTATLGGEEASFDAAILAVGVTGNHEDLGLDATTVEVDRGFVLTDEHCRTAEPTIYAIGDLAGAPCLAHKASHEAIIAVEHIDGSAPHALNKGQIPGCTYCYPQVASIGITEKQGSEAGLPLRIGRFPLMANGKAIASGSAEGMIKTIFHRDTGELLGAHMLGAGVTEMIQGYAVAMGLETTEAELIGTVFPHPTLSEAMHESVLSALGRTINL